jgi:hypothetical protein
MIDGAGNIGIGTAEPQSKLHIDGNVTAAESGITSGIKTTMTLTTSSACEELHAVSIEPTFSEPYSSDSIVCLNIKPSGAMVNYGIKLDLESAGNQNLYGIHCSVINEATGVYSKVTGTGKAVHGIGYSGGIGGLFETQSGIALKTQGGPSYFTGGGISILTNAAPAEALDVNGNVKSSGQFMLGNVRIGTATSDPTAAEWKYKGSLYINTSDGKLRINTANDGSATNWVVVGTQS